MGAYTDAMSRDQEPEDTRTAEDAIAQHGFGPSDADQLTAARQEIDELRAEVAELMSEGRKLSAAYTEAKQDRDACRQVIRDIYNKLGLDALVKTIAAAEQQLHEGRIPF